MSLALQHLLLPSVVWLLVTSMIPAYGQIQARACLLELNGLSSLDSFVYFPLRTAPPYTPSKLTWWQLSMQSGLAGFLKPRFSYRRPLPSQLMLGSIVWHITMTYSTRSRFWSVYIWDKQLSAHWLAVDNTYTGLRYWGACHHRRLSLSRMRGS